MITKDKAGIATFGPISIAFFLLFGLTEQRRNWYRALYWESMRRFGLRRKPRVDPMLDIILDDFRHAADRGIERTQDTIT